MKKSNNKINESLDKNKPRRKSKLFIINQDYISENKFIYFYLIPFWLLKKHKSFNKVYQIKDRICHYFSIERLNELIKFKENFDGKAKKYDSNDSNEIQKSN